jgi:type II secretory ATPase GspE/PulE/Tfp pilus assembly ATPase PilB-like protein
MVTAALRGVLAQRLMRRLCDKCKRRTDLTASAAADLGLPDKAATIYEPVGCSACYDVGYQGRLPIHEWFEVSRAIRELIAHRASVDDLRAASAKEGQRTMREAAVERVLRGETSVEEAHRLTKEAEEG